MSDLSEIGRLSIGQHEYGLTPEQSKRLRGESASEVRADARAMRNELGLDPIDEGGQQRDARGRYAGHSMNDVIRQAAGR